MTTIAIKKLLENAVIPKAMRVGDAGLDLTYIGKNIEIQPQERVLLETGIAMCIPDGYVGIIKDRSGIAYKHGLTTMAGVIDSNYRGEVKVLIHNKSNTVQNINTNERIAQIVIIPTLTIQLLEVNELPDSNRNAAGFGSTGK